MRLKSGARNLQTTRARTLRKEMSVSEKVAWAHLRAGKLGFKFPRQHPVGSYILDFYCPEAKVCVEIDGEQHALRQKSDALRDEALAELGVLTLRFPSLDLFERGLVLDGMLSVIYEACCERTSSRPPRHWE